MQTPRDYIEGFMRRVAAARVASQYTQDQMADLLNVKRNTYAHWERFSEDRITMMPIGLIPDFCRLTGISINYLLTGTEDPILTAYHATQGEDRAIVDRFLFGKKMPDSPLENSSSLHDKGRPFLHR